MHCYTISNQEEYSWFSSLTMCVCYSLFLYSSKKIIEDYICMNTNTNTNTNTNINTNNLFTKISNFKLINIKESHNDDYKQKMFQELLDMNSLERCFILYFIFKRKGDFKSLTSIEYIDNELTTIITNTYTNTNNTNTNNTNTNTNNTDVDEGHEKEAVIDNIIYEESEIETETEQETEEETEEDTPEDTEEDTPEDTEEETPEETQIPKTNTDTDTDIDETPILKTYNSYELYTKIMNKLNLDLDENSIPDIEIQIGEILLLA